MAYGLKAPSCDPLKKYQIIFFFSCLSLKTYIYMHNFRVPFPEQSHKIVNTTIIPNKSYVDVDIYIRFVLGTSRIYYNWHGYFPLPGN